jgi:hypothetical protein
MKYGHELAEADEERKTGVQQVRLAAYWYEAKTRRYVPISGLSVTGRIKVKRLREVMLKVGEMMGEEEAKGR